VTDQAIFCNTPWYELHIYWDGSLGICCQEDHKLYTDNSYNIANTTIAEWFNSEPVRKFRLAVLDTKRNSLCRRCYVEEDLGGNSRRHKSLQKSAIFIKQAFDASYQQSPGAHHFQRSISHNGHTNTNPIDLHIDLGNYCNLACKMCEPQASSTIAAQEVKWGVESSKKYLGQDWTRDPVVWQNFLDQLLSIESLQNIHFMGGETLLTDRLELLVDQLVAANRLDVCLSFVTNGTVYRPSLMAKLARFKRVGIEVSIETTEEHNAYQRQGTDTTAVLANIKQYLSWCNNDSITVTLRPAPSALTVGYFYTLLDYAMQHGLIITSNLCFKPEFLHVSVLPFPVKQQYLKHYRRFVPDAFQSTDYNASDPHNYRLVVAEQAQQIINVLEMPEPPQAESLRAQLVAHCRKWDQVYGLDARVLYPELQTLWDQHGY